MVRFPRHGSQDFELDDTIPREKTRWHGSTVEVTARVVPRYFWTTTSIDVFLDGRCILRTGGQLKITGSSSAEFYQDGWTHVVELSWEKVHYRGFPHQEFPFHVRIDGAKVAAGEVAVENAGMILIPLLFLASPILLALLSSLL